jgi:flagellar hook-associated protein 3 FlgL
MAISRITQNMMSTRAMTSIQGSLGKLAKTQEQLSTGRVLNRPSDSPTDTTSAMRIRSSVVDQRQFARNGEDGIGWLGTIDATLQTMVSQVGRAKDLALQGANAGMSSQASRDALATEIDQLRESLIASSNMTYLERPVFGGATSGGVAYDTNGQYVGTPAVVNRTIADGVKIQVNVDGPDAFGPAGANVFDDLATLANDLRAGNQAGISAGIDRMKNAQDRMITTLADVGTKYARVENAVQAAHDVELSLTNQLSEIENVDLVRATVDLQMQEVAYQAALGATARLVQPSLLDFLR